MDSGQSRRQTYIDALLDQHNEVPDEFRLWILEWPKRAAINCLWPGLPDEYCPPAEDLPLDRNPGSNLLGRIPALVHTIRLNIGDPMSWHQIGQEPPDADADCSDAEGPIALPVPPVEVVDEVLDLEDDVVPPEIWVEVPALLVHRWHESETWLALDLQRASPLPFGVYIFQELEWQEYNGADNSWVLSSWISYLHHQLRLVEGRFKPNFSPSSADGRPAPSSEGLVLWADSHATGRSPATSVVSLLHNIE
ncbi:hypothetical protein C8R47DRAFT_760191 [Mycena vitilis]|nr:hypothetical protein C8R47DRAFT_760043 [Mycena vitilis]KAJ6470233.1 hypothetical protein C8R47DRAFT_760191 [Mycena vitilis]